MAVSAVAATLALVVAVVMADAYGTVVNDRACGAAVDSPREQRAAGTTEPELSVLEVIAERYCSEGGHFGHGWLMGLSGGLFGVSCQQPSRRRQGPLRGSADASLLAGAAPLP